MHNSKRKYKLAYFLKIFWGILFLAIFVLFLFFDYYVKKIQTKQITENLQDTMAVYVNSLDSSLDSVKKYLYLSLENSEEVIRIESERKDLSYYIARQNVHAAIYKILGFNNDICEMVFHYSGKEGNENITAGNISDIHRKEKLESVIIDQLENWNERKNIKRGCDFYSIEESVYMVQYYKINNSYLGIGVSTDTVFSALSSIRDENGVELFITDSDGRVIDGTVSITKNLPPILNGTIVEIEGKQYLISEAKSEEGNFYVGTLTSKEVIYQERKKIANIIVILFTILIAVFFPGNILLVDQFIIKPISHMVESMQQLGAGNLDIRMKEKSRIQEYCMLENTFNDMSGEIKKLKIENYETQIKKQKAELQYLQLQVSPHFYLNALNIIYSLAQIQDFAQIQKMTMHLVNYSRYMFHNVQELVPLEEELRHVNEYIEIQKMRFGDFEMYQEDVEENLKKELIPPFVLQSFVENSVKYAMRNRKNSRLYLSGKFSSEENVVILTVRDNGDGYSQDVLESINSETAISEDSEKNIGIRNVKERLHIIYGKRAIIKFFNDNGAVTQIRLPLILRD